MDKLQQVFADENATYEDGFYVTREGNSIMVAIPRNEDFPDGARNATMVGVIENGKLTIQSINVIKSEQGKGLGSKLIEYVQNLPEVTSIDANATVEAFDKGFYEKNNFQLKESKMYQWIKTPERV